MVSLMASQIVPYQLIEPLRILGRHDWLEWSPSNGTPPTTRFRLNLPDDPRLLPHDQFIRMINMRFLGSQPEMFELYAWSKWLANGPKVVRPTDEQCEVLSLVDVKLGFRDYQQPFPVFLVEFPKRLRKNLTEKFGCECPRFVLSLHDDGNGYIGLFTSNGSNHSDPMTILSPRPQWRTIEDALRLCAEADGPDLRQAEILYRLGINFGLLMTTFGVKDSGPVDPKAHAKQQRNARQKQDLKAERARRLLGSTVNLIEFSQDVVLFDKGTADATELIGKEVVKRPHWRRGHFRGQRCGKGRSERKVIFVKPCLVRRDSFHGDLSNTGYCIRIA